LENYLNRGFNYPLLFFKFRKELTMKYNYNQITMIYHRKPIPVKPIKKAVIKLGWKHGLIAGVIVGAYLALKQKKEGK
jgi:hypothetical protein